MQEAARFAVDHLQTLKRRSGDDYAQHGLEVAATLQEATDDVSLLRVAILHDVLVDKNGPALLRSSPLTPDEQRLVRRMHRMRRLHIDEKTRDLDTVIGEFVADPRVTLLRMAHRCTDVEHIDRFSPSLQKSIARETLHMYTSIAGRLSMHAWRHRMEERCFRTLHGAAAERLEEQMRSLSKNDTACLRHATRYLQRALRAAKIPADISTRRKGLYSCYRKMILKERALTELNDRLALRIVVRGNDDCYRALGTVHATLRPMPGKLKDYIGAPKENGYRSIHTVVFPLPGVTEFPLEVQIRTAEMDRECEYGIAAHGGYKSQQYTLDSATTRANLFRNLAALRMENETPAEFSDALRHYFDDKQLLLFDDRGTAWYLHKPATVADFACHAAGPRAARLRQSMINGRPKSPDTPLQDGDTVMLRFGRTAQNIRMLIRCCKHPHAREMLAGLKPR